MIDIKLKKAEQRYLELSGQLTTQVYKANSKEFQKISKEYSDMGPLMGKIGEYRKAQQEREDTRLLIAGNDSEMKSLAQTELADLDDRINRIESELKILLTPKDPSGDKNAIMEIRAGTGGDEAALFAADLFRMYSKYIEKIGMKTELISSSPTEIGGFKEIIFSIIGKGAYGLFRFESGTHRVQRIPQTETSGRIHTSAATVAVLPEVDEEEIQIKDADLRIDTFCSSGAGGQSVNTTYSAVRITHIPTGLVVQCQDERSQLKNKAKAMKVLYARVKEKKETESQEKISSTRKTQIGSGDRSEKIRTYNYPQNRISDHRVGLTLYQLDKIMDGDIKVFIDALSLAYQEEQLVDAD